MKIRNITSESGNDFSAIMECEHCEATHKITSGYHDNFYHTRVIPAMTCKACGKNRDGVVPETANDNGTLSVA
jgi:C4-type Zn-finger protein